MAEKNLTLYLA